MSTPIEIVDGKEVLLVQDQKNRRLAEQILVALMAINRRLMRRRHHGS